MLSPPSEIKSNRLYRVWLLDAARMDRTRKALRNQCKRDISFYINSFVWTYDPRKKRDKSMPFVLWDFQERALKTMMECIEEGRDLVIEKSRDMGASWLSLILMEYLWHFHPGYSFLMVSRKEDLVDAPGDPDSLFWKLDFIHRHLPSWLLPRIDRRRLHFGNLDNSSTIDGESTTAAAGVGGRRTAVFIDEFSRIEEGAHLVAGTADTTNCRIFNFTPWGTNNAAYELARRVDIRKLRMHWSEHPEKRKGLYQYDQRTHSVKVLDRGYFHGADFCFIMDGRLRSPWYDGECKRRANDREVAQMLDIDYQGSDYQYFDTSIIRTLQRSFCSHPIWEGDIRYEQDTGRPLELVKGTGGPLRLWCALDGRGHPPLAPYGTGADIAGGSGATNSCLSIVNARTGDKVGEFLSPYIRPEEFAPKCVALCYMFKDERGSPALFAWEQQGPGLFFGKKVIELGFRNVYYRTNESDLAGNVSTTPGWYSTNETKRVLLEEYRAALARREFLNPSEAALEECTFFIFTKEGIIEHSKERNKLDPTSARENHGDFVIADALAWKMCRLLVTPQRKKEKKNEPPLLSLAWRRALADNSEREEREYA